MNLFEHAMVTLGIVYCMTQSVIAYPIRKQLHAIHVLLGQLVSCPPCFGFWVGLTLWLLHASALKDPFASAFYSCAVGAMWAAWGLATTIEVDDDSSEET